MPNSLPFVSIIIPTYNRSTLLKITIDSLVKMHYPTDLYEIIVCDNNSGDSTRDVIEELKVMSPVSIMYLFENRQGVHFARNSAAKAAQGEILYFTDDDMIADANLLMELVKVFLVNPMIACATGKVLPKFISSPPQWVEKHLINYCLSLTDKSVPENLIVSDEDVVGTFSCHQAIKREVFFKSGGFNPENTSGVWLGDGEGGLNLKIKALGYLFAYTQDSLIYHIIPPDRMTLRYLIKRLGNEGNSNSYTKYREHRRRELIIPGLIKLNTIEAMKLFRDVLVKIIRGRTSWRFLPAYFMYMYNRTKYDWKLFWDAEFRRMVEVDNWLSVEIRAGSFTLFQ